MATVKSFRFSPSGVRFVMHISHIFHHRSLPASPLSAVTYGTFQITILLLQQILSLFSFPCFHGWTAPNVSWSPLWGFSIALNHTIFGRTALNKRSAVVDTSTWQHTTLTRDLYPCTPWDSNPQSPASKRPQTYALDRAATRTDKGSVRWAKSAVHGQAYSVYTTQFSGFETCTYIKCVHMRTEQHEVRVHANTHNRYIRWTTATDIPVHWAEGARRLTDSSSDYSLVTSHTMDITLLDTGHRKLLHWE